MMKIMSGGFIFPVYLLNLTVSPFLAILIIYLLLTSIQLSTCLSNICAVVKDYK